MEDRIRICYLTFMFSPIVGGAETRTQKQGQRLQALGHNVVVVTARHDQHWKRKEIIDGLPVIRVSGMYRPDGSLRTGRLGHLPLNLSILLTLWRLRYSYDMIHVIQLSPSAAAATLIGKLTHKPVIISIQSVGPSAEQTLQLEKGVTLMADTLTDASFLNVNVNDWVAGDITELPQSAFGGHAILNFLRKSDSYYHILSKRSYAYITSHGFRTEQIVHIPNGVNTEEFKPAPERCPAPTCSERDIICVARMEYPKGVDVLLHAWGRMMQASDQLRVHLKPRLLLVGDGVFKPQLERIAAELGIQGSVEFLGQRRDIVDLLQKSWGFVMPSRWEGMPNALLEGMSCGLPCVATCVSGTEDIIVDGMNGLLVEPEQPAEMAVALRRIIEDTELARRLGQEGRATMLRDYQMNSIVDRYLQFYQHILTKGKQAFSFALEGRGE